MAALQLNIIAIFIIFPQELTKSTLYPLIKVSNVLTRYYPRCFIHFDFQNKKIRKKNKYNSKHFLISESRVLTSPHFLSFLTFLRRLLFSRVPLSLTFFVFFGRSYGHLTSLSLCVLITFSKEYILRNGSRLQVIVKKLF